MTTAETTRQVGRPSKYSPAYCEEVISTMAEGLSLSAFAGDIGVSRETIYEWERTIPEFSDSIKIARAKRVGKLERDLLMADSGPKVTSRIFALKNADPVEWRDKVTTEHTGKDGGPIETVDLTKAEKYRRLAFLLEKAKREAV